mmetsp:Transcript_8663/g.21573  ORF Transcript_8663/g.21573 Transcript_8663/m.21573 type:complete len:115 (+) Transcript_8663:201-545(+)
MECLRSGSLESTFSSHGGISYPSPSFMSDKPLSQQTTCAALAVEGAVRGATVGACWGTFSGSVPGLAMGADSPALPPPLRVLRRIGQTSIIFGGVVAMSEFSVCALEVAMPDSH